MFNFDNLISFIMLIIAVLSLIGGGIALLKTDTGSNSNLDKNSSTNLTNTYSSYGGGVTTIARGFGWICILVSVILFLIATPMIFHNNSIAKTPEEQGINDSAENEFNPIDESVPPLDSDDEGLNNEDNDTGALPGPYDEPDSKQGNDEGTRIEDYNMLVWTHREEDIVTLYLYFNKTNGCDDYCIEYKEEHQDWSQAKSITEIEESTESDPLYFFPFYSELYQGVVYDFRIKYFNGESYVFTSTKTIAVPYNDIEAPTNVTVEDVGSNYITLSWDTVPKATTYIPHWYLPEDNLGHFTSDTCYTLEELLPDTKYEITVEARYDYSDKITIARESNFIFVKTLN